MHCARVAPSPGCSRQRGDRDMTQDEKNEIIARAYKNIADVDELLAQPRPDPEDVWPRVPRRAIDEDRNEKRNRLDKVETAVRRLRAEVHADLGDLAEEIGRLTGAAEKKTAERIASMDAAIGEIRAELRAEFQAAIAERDARINELAGELALMRALQPKRLLRKSAVTINGSVVGADGHIN